MPFAIELHFDPAATLALATLWTELQRISGVPRRSELGIQPHVSLAVLSAPPSELEPAVRQFARRIAPFDLRLGRVDFFPGSEGVVFIEAIPSDPLLQVHRDLAEVLQALGAVNSPYYESPRWRPHCTAATDVAADLMPQVMAAASAFQRPSTVRAVALCGVSYRPVTFAFGAPLNGAHSTAP